MDSVPTSAVWIDGGLLFGFEQIMNPGDSVLRNLFVSDADVRDRAAEINDMQAQLTVAASLSDGEERAEHLSPLLRCGVFPAQQEALKELGKSGPAAVPVMSRMLHDPDFQYQTEFSG